MVALAEPAGFQNKASGPSATDTNALPSAWARGAPASIFKKAPALVPALLLIANALVLNSPTNKPAMTKFDIFINSFFLLYYSTK